MIGGSIFPGFFGFNLHGFTPAGIEGSANYLNDIATYETFNFLTNIALARFKWNNLPKSCNERALEITLFFYGKAVFFYDENLGLIHTPVNCDGNFNLYFESVKRTAHSYTIEKELDIDNSVLVRCSMTDVPDYLTVWNYAPRIANCLRSIDVHTETLKRPFLIRCNEKEKESVRNAINKIKDNEVAVVGSKYASNGEFEVLNLGTQSALADMWANIKNYYGQCFDSLGIKNSYSEKKERLIMNEVDGQANSTRHMLQNDLVARQMACKQINEMFAEYLDAPISVEANELEVFQDEVMEMYASRVTGITDDPEQKEEVE